jgi:anti-sigma B factor antagonist
MRNFKLTEIDRDSGCREIQVEGELDLAVADQLQECVDRTDSGYAAILINLAECEFIDSTGIALIVGARKRMAERGQRLVICAPSDQVLRILSVTGLMGNGLVFENATEALAGLQRFERGQTGHTNGGETMTENPDPHQTPRPEEDAPKEAIGSSQAEDGRMPPPDDLQNDPAYEPDEPLKGIKGG